MAQRLQEALFPARFVQVGSPARHSRGTGISSVVLGPRVLDPENGFDDKFDEALVEPG